DPIPIEGHAGEDPVGGDGCRSSRQSQGEAILGFAGELGDSVGYRLGGRLRCVVNDELHVAERNGRAAVWVSGAPGSTPPSPGPGGPPWSARSSRRPGGSAWPSP